MELNGKNIVIMDKKDIPKDAVRVHLYHFSDVLRPRGRKEKEALSLDIFERLKSSYESWTNPEYGDNPPIFSIQDIILSNLSTEVSDAVSMFNNWVKDKRHSMNIGDKNET